MFHNTPTNEYNPPKGILLQTSETSTTTFYVEKTANHTEISIMKSQWNLICRKIDDIKLKNHTINVYELIIGAAIPYTIEIIKDYSNQQQPDYFPIFLCFISLVITYLGKKFFSSFSDHSAENSIHLSDVRKIINDINNSQSIKSEDIS